MTKTLADLMQDYDAERQAEIARAEARRATPEEQARLAAKKAEERNQPDDELYENDHFKVVEYMDNFYHVIRKRDGRDVTGQIADCHGARDWIKRQEETHAAAKKARYVFVDYT